MIACIDVGYRDPFALAACALISDWQDASPLATYTARIDQVEAYVPGAFYKRELPCIERILCQLPTPPKTIVIDGFVWLDDAGKQGLGARLFDALGGGIPVVGVAKTSFATASTAIPIYRGNSSRPLWITAAGVDVPQAAAAIRSMHGNHRLPTILTLVDNLSKQSPIASPRIPKIP